MKLKKWKIFSNRHREKPDSLPEFPAGGKSKRRAACQVIIWNLALRLFNLIFIGFLMVHGYAGWVFYTFLRYDVMWRCVGLFIICLPPRLASNICRWTDYRSCTNRELSLMLLLFSIPSVEKSMKKNNEVKESVPASNLNPLITVRESENNKWLIILMGSK